MHFLAKNSLGLLSLPVWVTVGKLIVWNFLAVVVLPLVQQAVKVAVGVLQHLLTQKNCVFCFNAELNRSQPASRFV